jgi:hypothetical protein
LHPCAQALHDEASPEREKSHSSEAQNSKPKLIEADGAKPQEPKSQRSKPFLKTQLAWIVSVKVQKLDK